MGLLIGDGGGGGGGGGKVDIDGELVCDGGDVHLVVVMMMVVVIGF